MVRGIGRSRPPLTDTLLPLEQDTVYPLHHLYIGVGTQYLPFSTLCILYCSSPTLSKSPDISPRACQAPLLCNFPPLIISKHINPPLRLRIKSPTSTLSLSLKMSRPFSLGIALETDKNKLKKHVEELQATASLERTLVSDSLKE